MMSSKAQRLLAVVLLLASQQRRHQQCHAFSASSVNLFNQPQNIFVPRRSKQWEWRTKTHHWINNRKCKDSDTKTNRNNAKDDGDDHLKTSSWSFAFPTLGQSKLEFPKVEFPSALIQEAHEEYLQRHQIVKKRRVLQRLLEINSILTGQILRPLLCSIVKTKPDLSTIHIPTDEDWDAFWRQRRGRRKLTNAERVAQGVPALGPTFVKLAQILATRPDILPVPLAEALGSLQDNMPPFDNLTAKRMIRTDMKTVLLNKDTMPQSPYLQSKQDLQAFMESLSDKPVAAASVAQVYKGYLPGYGPVAVKVLRPGIQRKVERDATLFHSIATWVERLNNNTMKLPGAQQLPVLNNIGSIPLVQAVDEFTSRVLEDMDFTREAENMKAFAQLYCSRTGTSPTVQVVVPEVIPELSSDRVIVMEWLEGTKLTDVCTDCDERPQQQQENLDLIVQAIEMTVSQLLSHGLLHGDPHLGNVLKVRNPTTGKPELGYLDFGLVSYVPPKFRDGIVIAVVQLVFARNVEAVADLCVDLGLLPEETVQDAGERQRFVTALKEALRDILIWPTNTNGISTAVPVIRFENLLPVLSDLTTNFRFTVPPYLFNNIRALATLEGMALKHDPDFNVLRVIYPYSLNRLMRNPTVSKRVQETFLGICRSPDTQLISPRRVRMLLNDWALWTGYRKRRIAWDLVVSAGGRRVAPVILHNWLLNRIRNVKNLAWQSQRVVVRGCRKVMNSIPLIGQRQENMVF